MDVHAKLFVYLRDLRPPDRHYSDSRLSGSSYTAPLSFPSLPRRSREPSSSLPPPSHSHYSTDPTSAAYDCVGTNAANGAACYPTCRGRRRPPPGRLGSSRREGVVRETEGASPSSASDTSNPARAGIS